MSYIIKRIHYVILNLDFYCIFICSIIFENKNLRLYGKDDNWPLRNKSISIFFSIEKLIARMQIGFYATM